MTSNLRELISEKDILDRTTALAAEIRSFFGDEQISCICVLKGSYLFFADLVRRLGIETRVDFVQVSSYGEEKTSSGIVQIRKDLDQNIEGKNVLIVEDIVDTGLTLNYLKQVLLTRNPKSLKVCSLLSKPAARTHDAPIDFVGFEIANEFVVGYGLDYAEQYRTLPYIAVLSGSE